MKEAQIVCPWWCCFTFDNPLRRLVQNPERILAPYVKPGFTLLDVGPGMGYFTIALARLVGENGKVIAADLQQHMLDAIRRRAEKAGVAKRIVLHQSQQDSIGVSEPLDFALAFWMVHEVPDRARFFEEITANLKPGGLLLLAEPKIHTPRKNYDTSLEIAVKTGLKTIEHPKIFLSYTSLLKKGE